jgi:hypothetical protein
VKSGFNIADIPDKAKKRYNTIENSDRHQNFINSKLIKFFNILIFLSFLNKW